MVVVALALAVAGRAEQLTRVVDAAGADVADTALPAEVLAEVTQVRAKDTWAAGQSVAIVRAMPAGARGDGELALVQGERALPGVMINSKTPFHVASFALPPDPGWKLRATLFGHRATFKDVPQAQGVILWLGDMTFQRLPPGELVEVSGRVTLPSGEGASGAMMRVIPKGGARGPAFGVSSGKYQAQLGPGEYVLQPEVKGFRAEPQALRVNPGGATGPDFILTAVDGLSVKPQWPKADHDIKLHFDAQNKLSYVMDQKVTLEIALSSGQYTIGMAGAQALVGVFPGPFSDAASSLAKLRAAPKKQPWTGPLKAGDLITVAVDEATLVAVVEVDAVMSATAAAAPEPSVEPPPASPPAASPAAPAGPEKAYEDLKAARGDDDPQVMTARFRLARSLVRDGKGEQAAPHLKALVRGFVKLKGAESSEVATCLHELGLATSVTNPQESRKWLDKAAAIRARLKR